MRALEAIGFSLAVIGIVVLLFLFMSGGPTYRRRTAEKDDAPAPAPANGARPNGSHRGSSRGR
jgi:hypothetical protein